MGKMYYILYYKANLPGSFGFGLGLKRFRTLACVDASKVMMTKEVTKQELLSSGCLPEEDASWILKDVDLDDSIKVANFLDAEGMTYWGKVMMEENEIDAQEGSGDE